jgi:outer membrane biogenesis lipoprotein LolB
MKTIYILKYFFVAVFVSFLLSGCVTTTNMPLSTIMTPAI